jgi:hypothetical protein
MLVKNEKEWGDKIRIVGLSMDDTLKAAKDRVIERKWEKVEHY